jgi:hypothetical protein
VSSSPSSHTVGYDLFLFSRIRSNGGQISLLTQVKSAGLAPGDDATLATANLGGTTDTYQAITITGVVRQQLSSASGDVSITATLTFTRDPSATCILAGTATQGITM